MRPIFVIDEDQTLIIFCNANNMHRIGNGYSVPKNTKIQTFGIKISSSVIRNYLIYFAFNFHRELTYYCSKTILRNQFPTILFFKILFLDDAT